MRSDLKPDSWIVVVTCVLCVGCGGTVGSEQTPGEMGIEPPSAPMAVRDAGASMTFAVDSGRAVDAGIVLDAGKQGDAGLVKDAGTSSPPPSTYDAGSGAKPIGWLPPETGALIGDPTKWTNLTANVKAPNGALKFSTMQLASAPGSDQILVGLSQTGVFSSTNGGETWAPIGAPGQINHMPNQFVFDPRDLNHFWWSGMYGDCLYETKNRGATVTRIGTLTHCDGVGVDFKDPLRKTIVVGLHEKAHGLMRSTDNGTTWSSIGDNLPSNTNFASENVMFDADHMLVSSSGWLSGAAWGIFRTNDGGKSFTKVADDGPQYPALVTSDGTLYWSTLWNGEFVRSTDGGDTWTKLSNCPVRTRMIELPNGTLVGAGGMQLYASKDHGATWQPLGPPIPIKPYGVVYNSVKRVFLVNQWGSTTDAVYRWPYALP